jgi:hypothetical protein
LRSYRDSLEKLPMCCYAVSSTKPMARFGSRIAHFLQGHLVRAFGRTKAGVAGGKGRWGAGSAGSLAGRLPLTGISVWFSDVGLVFGIARPRKRASNPLLCFLKTLSAASNPSSSCGTGSTAFPGCGAAVVLGPLTAPGRQGPLFHLPLPLCPWVLGYNRDKTTE